MALSFVDHRFKKALHLSYVQISQFWILVVSSSLPQELAGTHNRDPMPRRGVLACME